AGELAPEGQGLGPGVGPVVTEAFNFQVRRRLDYREGGHAARSADRTHRGKWQGWVLLILYLKLGPSFSTGLASPSTTYTSGARASKADPEQPNSITTVRWIVVWLTPAFRKAAREISCPRWV